MAVMPIMKLLVTDAVLADLLPVALLVVIVAILTDLVVIVETPMAIETAKVLQQRKAEKVHT